MYYSGEARWFFRGEASAAAERWIADGGLTERAAARVDQYLVLPGCSTTGVKIREGKFEVKARTSPAEPVTWSEQIAGFRDTWIKWSRTTQDTATFTDTIQSGEHWAFVSKRRSLRLFSLDSGQPTEVRIGGPWLSAGCQVEMSDIRVAWASENGLPPENVDWERADRWWSFCFEAFGEPGSVLNHLDTVVRHVAAEAPDLELPREASMSYPAWLAALLP